LNVENVFELKFLGAFYTGKGGISAVRRKAPIILRARDETANLKEEGGPLPRRRRVTTRRGEGLKIRGTGGGSRASVKGSMRKDLCDDRSSGCKQGRTMPRKEKEGELVVCCGLALQSRDDLSVP